MTMTKGQKEGIVFICGSLQPGADGIGDYSRRMAGEIKRHGCKVALIAFNDKHIKNVITEIQYEKDIEVEVLRLPSNMQNEFKIKRAQEIIERVNPEWISIQYVLYAFNDRGLPFQFTTNMEQLCQNRKVHVMFHELWLGIEKYPTFKDKLYSVLQKNIVKKMIEKLKPAVVHTHSSIYHKLLNLNGIPAKQLQILSNIPLFNEAVQKKPIGTNNKLSFLVFGFISPGAPIKQFAKELKAYSVSKNIQVEVIFSGRNGASLNVWKDALTHHQIPFSIKGVLSVQDLSDLMTTSDIGICTTPFFLFEKSGSVAAMFNHGLPVINVASAVEWEPEVISTFKSVPTITEYMPGEFNIWISNLKQPIRKKTISIIAKQMREDLTNAVKSATI